jgi:glutathione synthase
MDAVLMRKDPPFDVDYLHAAHLLELAEANGTFVMNRPAGLRAANEKLYALHFDEYMPDTVVTRDRQRIRAFMGGHGGRCILKPVDGYGGRGVFKLEAGATNTSAIIDQMTQEGAKRVVVQAYIPEASQGDKRVLMLDGEPMGAILRVPPEDDHRGNIHVGGSVEKTSLTDREDALCRDVGERLVEDGLYFVGLDLIGERLTEVNVTSPTGIQEMSRLNDVDGAGTVIDWVADRAVG